MPPKIGNRDGLIKDGYIGVVKGSRNQEAAEFFINTYLSSQAQLQFAIKVGAIPMVEEARTKMAEVPLLRELLVLDGRKIDAMLHLNAAKIDLSRWNDEWNRVVSR